MDKFKFIYDIFHTIGLRKVVFILFITMSLIVFIKEKRKRKNNEFSDEQLEELFEKNEEGLFPWEVDTNDSPQRVDKNAKKYNIKQYGPQRGRW